MEGLSQVEREVVNRMRTMVAKKQWGEVAVRFEDGRPTFVVTETKEKLSN